MSRRKPIAPLPVLPDGPIKCVMDDRGSVTPCRALLAGVESHSFERRKGITEYSLINIETGKHSRTFYGIRSGIYAARGMAFNFCPFCGAVIERQARDEGARDAITASAQTEAA